MNKETLKRTHRVQTSAYAYLRLRLKMSKMSSRNFNKLKNDPGCGSGCRIQDAGHGSVPKLNHFSLGEKMYPMHIIWFKSGNDFFRYLARRQINRIHAVISKLNRGEVRADRNSLICCCSWSRSSLSASNSVMCVFSS